MYKLIVIIALIACTLFQIGCTSTNKVVVEKKDFGELGTSGTIFVTVKDGMEYELDAFTITETYIEGRVITRDHSGRILIREKMKIEMKDVMYITAEKSEISWKSVIVISLVTIGIISLVTVLACALAGS